MDEPRVTAWWYVSTYGLTGQYGTLEALAEIGLRAARLARWYGIPEQRIPEGPYPAVHTWPERIWAEVIWSMTEVSRPPGFPVPVQQHARGFDGDPCGSGIPPGAGNPGSAWDYQADETIPLWCPLPQGDQALRDIGC